MKYLSYQDVLLVANYSELETRDHADTSVNLCGWKFELPVVPANMQDVINPEIAKYLSENGFFYIYHRFGKGHSDVLDEDLDTVYFVKLSNQQNWRLISISTGVNEDSFKEIFTIKALRLRVDFITIDVAHGHHLKVKQRIQWIKENLPKTKIIAGNVMTADAVDFLAKSGADIVKVGIGQGSICTTRFQTGFSMPMFICVGQCSIESQSKVPIIADGGVQHIGDIPKALVAGAAMVMSGKLFASCINSPAKIIDNHKQYRGSTSFAAKKHNKHIEGKVIDLEADITVQEKLIEIKEALQSAISYAGGENLSSFQNVKWIEGK